jgi:hypothetical protein
LPYSKRHFLPLFNQCIVVRLIWLDPWQDVGLAAFVKVAGLASSHTVSPCGLTTVYTWYNVVNGQVLKVKNVITVLTLEQVPQVHIVPTKPYTLLEVKVIFCDTDAGHIDGQFLTVNYPIRISLDYIDFPQEHQFYSMTPINDTKREYRNRFIVTVEQKSVAHF